MRALAATRSLTDEQQRRRWVAVIVYLMAAVVATTVSAQRPKTDQDDDLKVRIIELKTKDGVELRAFYKPSDKGKEAIPVLLVHEWQGQASPYGKLVDALSKSGCAVLAPDLRGHGGSKEFTNPRGEKESFNLKRMSKRDVENIVRLDLESAKAFLKKENNEEKLNLNALVVIGVGEGCVMAAHWAQRDWSFRSVGRMKQGQDVKCLVFISPEKQVKGIGIDPTLANPHLLRLPIMMVVGAKSPEASEAERIAKRIESIKKRQGRGTLSGFDLQMPNTGLSGPSLVTKVSGVVPAITKFITSEVKISDDENPWIERN
jgi:pimeloyl-ACP methyl ester carboxylesterase